MLCHYQLHSQGDHVLGGSENVAVENIVMKQQMQMQGMKMQEWKYRQSCSGGKCRSANINFILAAEQDALGWEGNSRPGRKKACDTTYVTVGLTAYYPASAMAPTLVFQVCYYLNLYFYISL